MADTILDPMEVHIHSLGALLFHGLIGKTGGGGVVNLHGCRRLGMREFLKSGADWHVVLPIKISGSDFGLGGGADHDVKDFSDIVDRYVARGDGLRRLGGVGGSVA